MAASLTVAKKKGKPGGGSVPLFHATVTYKTWVWAQMIERGWGLPDLEETLNRMGVEVTDSALSQFLGPKDLKKPREPSNTHLMPAINRIFKMPHPPIFDPANPLLVQRDRFLERYGQLSPRERKFLDSLLADDPRAEAAASDR